MPDPITAVIGGGTLLSGFMGADAAEGAADTQASSARDANALQLQMYNQSRADLQPWRDVGVDALRHMNVGLQPGGQFARNFTQADFQADPGYQFRVSEGEKGIERSAAARGGLLSGAAGKAMSRFNQDTASNEFSNAYNRFRLNNSDVFNRYASAAGTGQTATAQQANQGANYANTVGNNLMQAGNAQAAGQMGVSNAWTGAMNQGISAYQGNQFLQALQKPTTPTSVPNTPAWGYDDIIV